MCCSRDFRPSLLYFVLLALRSQKDTGTILSTHVHNNKQQGSIHLHQSLNWHILRFSCTSSQCSDTAYEMLCSRFLTFNVSFASQCGLIHASFLSSLFSPYLALEVNEHFFYLFNTLIHIYNESTLYFPHSFGRIGVLFPIHLKSIEAFLYGDWFNITSMWSYFEQLSYHLAFEI